MTSMHVYARDATKLATLTFEGTRVAIAPPQPDARLDPQVAEAVASLGQGPLPLRDFRQDRAGVRTWHLRAVSAGDPDWPDAVAGHLLRRLGVSCATVEDPAWE